MQSELAEQWLGHIEALSAEIETAMQSVASNALETLEGSIRRQQMLCSSLLAVPSEVKTFGMQLTGKNPASDSGVLEERVAHARFRLESLSRTYAALLAHSGESLRMLAALCASHEVTVNTSRTYTGSYWG